MGTQLRHQQTLIQLDFLLKKKKTQTKSKKLIQSKPTSNLKTN